MFGILYNILTYSAGSIVIGILATAVCIALMFYIIKSWHKNRSFTALSYIIGCVAFIFILFHAILICGAVVIKSYGNDAESLINSYVTPLSSSTIFTQEDTQELFLRLRNDLPIVGYYIASSDFSGHTPYDIASSMNQELQRHMNWNILRHFLWSIFFVFLGALGIIKSMEIHKSKNTGFNKKKRKFYDE